MTARDALRKAADALLAELGPEGFWTGELSSSALAGAVACIALHLNGDPADGERIQSGLEWIRRTQNLDGGWGDCPRSLSNPSTTLLALAALKVTGGGDDERAIAYLRGVLGDDIAAGIRQIYGDDRTFSVPILMGCALAGMVPWELVPRLPYPLAALPRFLYSLLKLQVVSYALPALIAVGLAIDKRRGQGAPGRLLEDKTLRLLECLQPDSGGFLEATPLTAFVAMALVSAQSRHPSALRVLNQAVAFLRCQQRADGSWPIDANLAQWVTSCAIHALRAAGVEPPRSAVQWTLANQTKDVHPFTGAAPGGWGWTNLSGSVPDGDDTSAALLALTGCRHAEAVPQESIVAGLRWLLRLQNADGGWPPFCRGWGRLPFDRSCADITAHALRAIQTFLRAGDLTRGRTPLAADPLRARRHGFGYLSRTQRADGSWTPLWFGSQSTRDNQNPVFGTARVLLAFGEADPSHESATKGVAYLLRSQGSDGGWGAAAGCPSKIQETSLALSALSCYRNDPEVEATLQRGLAYLIQAIENDGLQQAEPIGLYFAKLWYSEKLYPLIWTVEALGRCLEPGHADRTEP